MIWTNKGHEFDEIAEKLLNPKTEVYIWGGGYVGTEFLESNKEIFHIVGVIDSNEEKQGTKFCGFPICAPSVLAENPSAVVIVTVRPELGKEIIHALKPWGFVENKNAIKMEVLPYLFPLYQEEKLVVEKLVISITDYCTLRCEKCANCNPYIQDKRHMTVAEVLYDLDVFFENVDVLNNLCLIGGDCMTHPDLYQMLEAINMKYQKDKIGKIKVLTNAVIIPSKKLIKLFVKHDMMMFCTNYKEATKGKQQIEEVNERLKEYDMQLFVIEVDEWQDRGYPNYTIKPLEGLSDMVVDCMQFDDTALQGGKIYHCIEVYFGLRILKIPEAPSDSLNIYENDKINKKILFEYIRGYSDLGYFSFCSRCCGKHGINAEIVTPGVQLP